jgi:hypothetical protein
MCPDPLSDTPIEGDRGIVCAVEMYGLARILAETKSVEVRLPTGATASDLLAAVAARHPSLVGRVVRPDFSGVTEGHSLSINALDFVPEASSAILKDGDRLLILANAAGGAATGRLPV